MIINNDVCSDVIQHLLHLHLPTSQVSLVGMKVRKMKMMMMKMCLE